MEKPTTITMKDIKENLLFSLYITDLKVEGGLTSRRMGQAMRALAYYTPAHLPLGAKFLGEIIQVDPDAFEKEPNVGRIIVGETRIQIAKRGLKFGTIIADLPDPHELRTFLESQRDEAVRAEATGRLMFNPTLSSALDLATYEIFNRLDQIENMQLSPKELRELKSRITKHVASLQGVKHPKT
jgi:hypothetical protein